jgi:hypothetical protein
LKATVVRSGRPPPDDRLGARRSRAEARRGRDGRRAGPQRRGAARGESRGALPSELRRREPRMVSPPRSLGNAPSGVASIGVDGPRAARRPVRAEAPLPRTAPAPRRAPSGCRHLVADVPPFVRRADHATGTGRCDGASTGPCRRDSVRDRNSTPKEAEPCYSTPHSVGRNKPATSSGVTPALKLRIQSANSGSDASTRRPLISRKVSIATSAVRLLPSMNN